jgi:hypothetical protein
MTNPTLFCKDCAHFQEVRSIADVYGPYCHAPQSDPPVEPIRGRKQYPSPVLMRESTGKCGPEAVWFVSSKPAPEMPPYRPAQPGGFVVTPKAKKPWWHRLFYRSTP